MKGIDRSKWGPGPWMDEPDRLEFEHEGFPCIVQRVQGGHLCGYVAVPPGHPWHGVDLSNYPEGIEHPEVHGGITYAEKCVGNICHVPKPGESDDVWWLGFDHAHAGDRSPRDFTEFPGSWLNQTDTYKTIDYVKTGCESLARQALALARGGK